MAVAVVVLIVYVGVLVLYATSTRLEVAVDDRGSENGDSSIVGIEFTSVDPLGGTAQTVVRVLPAKKFIDGNLRLREDLTVEIISSFPNVRDDQARMGYTVSRLDFTRGSSILTLAGNATLTVDGAYQDYPFDVFRSTLVATASVPGKEAESAQLEVLGDVPSWLIRAGEVRSWPATGGTSVNVELLRSWSTKTFVFLLLAAMIVLAVLAMLVAVASASRRREAPVQLAGWFAAMLFALIPLRLNLPGAPPIGVWMDFVVVLWVLLAIMAGLALFITAWLRRTPAPDAPGTAASGPGTP